MPIENPSVRDYLMKRKAEREALENQAKEDSSGPNIAAALGAIGAGFQGQNSLAAGQSILDRQAKSRQAKISDFDASTDRYIKDADMDRSLSMQALEDDPNSEESKMATQLAERMGYKGGPVTATKFKTFSPALQKMYEIEQQKLNRQDARDERRFLAGERRQDKLDLLDEKRKEKELALEVPGYKRTGQVLPKPEEAMKFRKATAVSDQLNQKLNRMKELVKESGSFEYGGDNGTEMESLATEIQLLGKSPELYELGVLTGPDLSLLQKISADPTSLNSFFTRDASRQKQIDSQITSLQQKLGATATSMGYVPEEGAGKTVVKTQTNPKTGERREVYSDGTFKIISNPIAGR